VIEVIAIATLSVAATVLTALLIREKFLSNKLTKNLIQLIIDNDIMLNKMQEKSNEKDIEQTEGFVKFLSESREWAFEYIETVQDGLTNFVEVAGPRLEYFDKYGRVVDSPHSEGLEDILAAYRDLQKLLPEQNNKEK
jgi:hypothetical protein